MLISGGTLQLGHGVLKEQGQLDAAASEFIKASQLDAKYPGRLDRAWFN